MTTPTPHKWEIWLAEVVFEDDETQVKKRPVLVISPAEAVYISLKITSQKPRSRYDGEYRIQKWKEAGLKKESTIRISKVLKMLPSDFIHRLGKLHPVDISAVQTHSDLYTSQVNTQQPIHNTHSP